MRTGFPRHLLYCILAVAACAAPARAGEPTALFLIDGSGSMWGRFEPEKKAKIDTIRELLKPIVSGAAASAKVGLASFGHRRAGDCSDVEIIAAPAVERDGVLAPLVKLNPRGKGPLAEGLKQSAAAIGADRPASIVVIGDGIDNCRQDTCAAAAEIAKSSPGLAIHVISIDVDPAEHPRLTCITKETGGQFFSVSDPVGLAAAIDEASSKALGGAPAGGSTPNAVSTPQVAMKTEPRPVPDGFSLIAIAALADDKPQLALPISWRVLKADGTAAMPPATADRIAADLPPGTYSIEATAGLVTAKKRVTIEAGKPVSAVVPLNAGRLIVRAKTKAGTAPPESALVTISQAASGNGVARALWLGKFATADIVLPAAGYNVAIADGMARIEKQETVTAGAETVSEIDFNLGRLQLSASLTEGGEPLSDVTYALAEDDPESPDGRREITRSQAPKAEFVLAPGTYYVSARSGAAEVQQRVALSAGDIQQKTLILAAAALRLSATVGGSPPSASQAIVYRVTALDGQKREVARGGGAGLATILNAGRYRVAATLGGHGLSASQDITLEAGKPMSLSLKLDGGEISFKPPARAIAVPGEVFWEIKDQAGAAVWHTTAVEPKVFLAPGRYTVRVETRDKGTEAAFEVKPGENRQIELGGN